MTEILMVDDERAIRDSMARRLRETGFAVRVAATGAAGVAAFGERRPDLVLLDVMMPGMDGYAACKAMRSVDRETPIVFLSALDAEDDQIRGLEAGADDYVSKTASPALLEARIRKALERADRFSKMDAPAAMTKTEADIYRLLESDRGKFFSYREIFSAVCGEGYFADEGAIRVHVSNMRKKLPDGESLVAKRGVGYALVHSHPPTTR
ncbi:MAG: response regulator transcription factor [Kiritimatiellae bacterium]|nr:response regulator transcription factor [Kiritimatiellia bacterium]